MALQLREVSLLLDEDELALPQKVADYLGLMVGDLSDVTIVRKGIDARKKRSIKRVYTLKFSVVDEPGVLQRFHSDHRLTTASVPQMPVEQSVGGDPSALVVGSGPAGLFAALRLARQGVQVTLAERGEPVEARIKKVQAFWNEGVFDGKSNVQFGEGGAGTFSDGKLTTRVNSPFSRYILQTFVDCGAPPEILQEAKPHLGTDVLRRVLVNFRKMLEAVGVRIRFESQLTDLMIRDGRICGGVVNGEEEVPVDRLILAPGHSARDTYEMLSAVGVALEQKPFAVGYRVEHPAELINAIQYGIRNHKNLPTADYALSYNDGESGRGIYSFCMCPGGEIIAAPSEEGGMVVNGMSFRRRDSDWSNSALVVSVGPEDFSGSDPLAGVRFQREWEHAAFKAGGNNYHAPAQNLLDFLGHGSGSLQSTCRPGIREADLGQVLPTFIVDSLRRGLVQFDRKMKGFVTSEAVLVGIESRTSAPVRITRNKACESVSHPGLYPAGEGAGYAGGIMSAALDGIRVADNIVEQLKQMGRGVLSEKNLC